jgi:GNAT superfamily N-acetyltransferase
MTDLTTTIKSARECSTVERAAFLALVLQGGEVDEQGLPNRIARAEALLFLLHGRLGLIGISALKHPEDNYRKKVFAASCSECAATSFNLELGWLYLSEKQRRGGLSSLLIDPLLDIAADRSVFATCRSNNDAMHSILPRHGFRHSGDPYPAANGQYELNLFVRP